MDPAEVSERLEQALFEIRRVIAGQDAMLERVLVCLLAQGHLLIEGVPGLAKTLTIKTTAGVLGGIVRARPVHARPRPVRPRRHAHLPPGRGHVRHRARPGLLQLPARRRDQPRAGEGAVGAARGDAGAPGHDRRTRRYPVPDPFLVMATQNPIESEGTYPLPEAQVDRFMLKILIGYPEHDEELTIVQRQLVAAARAARGALARRAARRSSARSFDGLRRPGARQLRGRRSPTRRATPARARPRRARRLHRLRRQPARADQPRPGGARARARPRPRLRRSPRTCSALAKDALRHRLVLTLPGARRGGERRHDPRRGARRRAACRSSTSSRPSAA